MDYQFKPIDEPHLLFFDKKSMNNLLIAAGFVNVELSYFGEEIDKLPASFFKRKWMALRSKLIGFGLVWPFARQLSSVGSVLSPLESAVIAPFKAHTQTDKPAWWLRAIAQKG